MIFQRTLRVAPRNCFILLCWSSLTIVTVIICLMMMMIHLNQIESAEGFPLDQPETPGTMMMMAHQHDDGLIFLRPVVKRHRNRRDLISQFLQLGRSIDPSFLTRFLSQLSRASSRRNTVMASPNVQGNGTSNGSSGDGNGSGEVNVDHDEDFAENILNVTSYLINNLLDLNNESNRLLMAIARRENISTEVIENVSNQLSDLTDKSDSVVSNLELAHSFESMDSRFKDFLGPIFHVLVDMVKQSSTEELPDLQNLFEQINQNYEQIQNDIDTSNQNSNPFNNNNNNNFNGGGGGYFDFNSNNNNNSSSNSSTNSQTTESSSNFFDNLNSRNS